MGILSNMKYFSGIAIAFLLNNGAEAHKLVE